MNAKAAPKPDEAPQAHNPAMEALEGRVAALEADLYFLRRQFGWPTKST
jgi:hypothetical protein